MYLMIGAENGMKVFGFVETVQLKLGAEKAFEYNRYLFRIEISMTGFDYN